MANKATIVEINGRKYDANTGQLVTENQIDNSTPAAGQQAKPAGAPRNIDGFSSPITGTHPARPAAQVSANLHQTPQRSQKLHTAAAHPVAPKRVIRAMTSKQAAASQNTANASAHLPASAEQQRMQRAKQLQRSAQISKFGNDTPAKPAAPTAIQASQPAESAIAPYQPPALTAPAEKPKDLVQKIQPSQIEQSAAANEPAKKERKLKLAPTVAVVVLVVALAGYLTYLNMPNFTLKIASSRAGFAANLPGYNPDSYKFSGPVAYSPGQLTLRYASTKDGTEYKITQKESSWDSQSLLDNFVKHETSENPTTYQERGLTIYVYGNDNTATWVDGGIWYILEGSAQLSSEQILKIAGSL
jgi:hypothetical protein